MLNHNCAACGANSLVRSSRFGGEEFAASLIGLYPYRCRRCRRRSLRLSLLTAARNITTAALLIGTVAGSVYYRFHGSRVAQAAVRPVNHAQFVSSPVLIAPPGEMERMTNAEITQLSQTGINSRVLTRLVQRMPCTFDLSTKGVIALKQAGVADDVIETILARECLPTVVARPASSDPPERRSLLSQN